MKSKILIFTILISITALSQPGTLDATFGNNGKLTTGFGSNQNWANGFAMQPDGKFLVGGTYVSDYGPYDFALARYNADGSLDTTFGLGGKVVTNFFIVNSSFINSIYCLPNGKIMVFGGTGQLGLQPAIARYNANGTPDTTFGVQGKLISLLAQYTLPGNKLVFQPDGKFIITAQKLYNLDPNNYLAIERYTEDGVLDTSFGTAGQTVTSFGNGKSIPSDMVLQPDGKIVVAGTYTQNNSSVIGVTRFTTDGLLDTTFSGDGKLTTSFGSGTYAIGMNVAINPAGKISVAGFVSTSTSRNVGIVQYNTNGSLNTTFDTDGKVMTPLDLTDDYKTFNSITTQPDGKLLVVSYSDNYASPTSDFVTRRYNADGSTDTAFGDNGTAKTTFDTGLNKSQAAFVASNGDIFVVGQSIPLGNTHIDFAIAKYNSTGVLDTTMDGDGRVTTTFEQGNDQLKTILVLPNDQLIAVGISGRRRANNSTVADIAISKYNSDGSLDANFGVLGKVVSVLGEQINAIVAAILQPDGKTIVSNRYYNPLDTTYSFQALRYNADGSLDTLFGTNGKVELDFAASAIALTADGKILMTGSDFYNSSDGSVLNRYNPDGTLDTSFGGDGSITIPHGEINYETVSMVVQNDGKVIISNTFSAQDVFNGVPLFATTRINTDGSLDTAFGDNGNVFTLIGDVCFAHASFLDANGNIIIAGKSVSAGLYFSSVRYNSNGVLDTTYGTGGIATTNLWNDYKEINSIFLQADGKFLVVLSKQNEVLNTYDFKTRRFNTDGTYDDDFGGATGVSTSFYNGYDEAFSIGLQSDDKIVIGGTTENGINRDFALARYNNTITLDIPEVDNTASTALDVMLYPNPTKDILNLKLKNSQLVISNYSISNMLGQSVQNGTVKEMAIDTKTLNAGIYTIAIKTNNGTVTKKFVKE